MNQQDIDDIAKVMSMISQGSTFKDAATTLIDEKNKAAENETIELLKLKLARETKRVEHWKRKAETLWRKDIEEQEDEIESPKKHEINPPREWG
jgi:hypothetical protein